MRRRLSVLLLLLAAPAAAAPAANPLVGTWILDAVVDTPEGGEPVYSLGRHPVGQIIFSADGHVAVELMRDPAGGAAANPDARDGGGAPDYISYFGTYSYDPAGPTWTTHVVGGNVAAYVGTDQSRSFRIEGDRLVIFAGYEADGRKFRAERILHRARR